jgi:ArsR family transcriptional regulator
MVNTIPAMETEILFHALSDATRRQILATLIERGECCVCHLYETLDMSQPKVSRHLAVLREAELVLARRDGLWVHYSLNRDLPDWAQTVLQAMAQGQKPDFIKSGKTCCTEPTQPINRRSSHA